MTTSTEAVTGVIRPDSYPELTRPGVLVGWLIGTILATSMRCAALLLGSSMTGSMTSAILRFGISHGVLRR